MSLEILPLKDPVAGGAVGGASSLTTVGSVTFVSPAGSITQDASNFFWDATNHRLGIGTNSPLWNLTVKGNDIMLTNDGTTGAQFTVASSQAYLRTNTTYPLNLGTNSATYIRIASTGPVGIGPSNTSPTGTLHVYDATASTGVTTLTVKAGAGQSTTNLQEWQNSSGTVLGSVTSGGYGLYIGAVLGSGNGKLDFNYYHTGMTLASDIPLMFSPTTASNGVGDTSLSRISPGIIGGGTGSAGSVAGSFQATKYISAGTAFITWGTGTPEAAVTATVGSLFLRTDGGAATTLYVKESGSGNTGWVAK